MKSHPFRSEINKYALCVNCEGDICNLPNSGGINDQDADELEYVMATQQAIRLSIKTNLDRSKVD